MPRGKELEQLPMAAALPSAGKDRAPFARESLEGVRQKKQLEPEEVEKENEDML